MLNIHNIAAPHPLLRREEEGCLDATGMIAGGTGVTPMYQVAKAILKDATDKTQISLLFANVSADDILIEDLLSELQESSPQFKV